MPISWPPELACRDLSKSESAETSGSGVS